MMDSSPACDVEMWRARSARAPSEMRLAVLAQQRRGGDLRGDGASRGLPVAIAEAEMESAVEARPAGLGRRLGEARVAADLAGSRGVGRQLERNVVGAVER